MFLSKFFWVGGFQLAVFCGKLAVDSGQWEGFSMQFSVGSEEYEASVCSLQSAVTIDHV